MTAYTDHLRTLAASHGITVPPGPAGDIALRRLVLEVAFSALMAVDDHQMQVRRREADHASPP